MFSITPKWLRNHAWKWTACRHSAEQISCSHSCSSYASYVSWGEQGSRLIAGGCWAMRWLLLQLHALLFAFLSQQPRRLLIRIVANAIILGSKFTQYTLKTIRNYDITIKGKYESAIKFVRINQTSRAHLKRTACCRGACCDIIAASKPCLSPYISSKSHVHM